MRNEPSSPTCFLLQHQGENPTEHRVGVTGMCSTGILTLHLIQASPSDAAPKALKCLGGAGRDLGREGSLEKANGEENNHKRGVLA